MAALTEELERRAPATAYVSLIADGPARFLTRGSASPTPPPTARSACTA